VAPVSTVGRSTPSSPTSPPIATLAPASSASSIHCLTRSVSPAEMSADTSVSSSSGGPTTRVATASTRAATKSSWIERWT
jgi:hypothetical protein